MNNDENIIGKDNLIGKFTNGLKRIQIQKFNFIKKNYTEIHPALLCTNDVNFSQLLKTLTNLPLKTTRDNHTETHRYHNQP